MASWKSRLGLLAKIKKASLKGIESPCAPLCMLMNYAVWILTRNRIDLRVKANSEMNIKKYKKESFYNIEGIKLPLLNPKDETLLFGVIFFETFVPYIFFQNRFFKSIHETYAHGVYYGLEMEDFSVVVEQGDVVFDIGSWIGDFAAYASKCGAEVYAFEPTSEIYEILCETAKLNPGITPVNLGLGDAREELPIFKDDGSNSGANSFRSTCDNNLSDSVSKIDTIDNFVAENNIKRVDFIKSDIEGFERKMLKGAKKALRDFAPKLAICTYHFPDDPEVLEKIILDANPDYRIVHMPDILFARV
ncbi:MAG: FkbM family methyltransferase [Synergistaceae bacterium]|nr:FkbM family methyltransferase [Synergistaceae bacterium]